MFRQNVLLRLISSSSRSTTSVTKNIFNNAPISTIRPFSVSAKQNAIPPFLWVFVKPISKLAAAFVGRRLRAHFKEFSLRNYIKKHKRNFATGGAGLGTLASIYYVAHLERTPITNRRRFMLFTSKQLQLVENLQTEQLMERHQNAIMAPKSQAVQRTLKVAKRLFAANHKIEGVSEIDWQLTVIDAPEANAFAFPNGHVIVYTGLLDFVKSDDELAMVMAHEMSHAILQHAAEQMSQEQIVAFISASFIFLVWMLIPFDIGAVLMHKASEDLLKLFLELPFSREMEAEADKVGLILAAKACFDVRYGSVFWRRMQSESKNPAPHEFISTHPSHENRAEELDKQMPSALKLRDECNCYKLPRYILT